MQDAQGGRCNSQILAGEIEGEVAAVFEEAVVQKTRLVVHGVVEFDVVDGGLSLSASCVQEASEGASAVEDELGVCVEVQKGFTVHEFAR